MVVYVNQKSVAEEENENFVVKAKFKSNEYTTAYGTLEMCYKAMLLEGYLDGSIIQAMYDIALEKADEKNYTIKEE